MVKIKSSLFGIYSISMLIRYCLFNSNYQKLISRHIEISTPVNSWKRVEEGLLIFHLNVCPYLSDIVHEPPLNLMLYDLLIKICGRQIYLIFMACDALTAMLLYYSVQRYMVLLHNKRKTNEIESSHKPIESHTLPQHIVLAYLINPFIVLNCVALTSTVFSNLWLAMFLAGLAGGYLIIAAFALAVSIHHNFYPVVLISPLFLQYFIQHKSTSKAITAVVMVGAIWSSLTYFSYSIFNNWDVALEPYKFMLEVANLQPNIGIFWYFFTEMFDHFYLLFLAALQINVLMLYLVPLSICFRNDPIILSTSLLSLLAIFKPYPCIGDVGFVLTLQLYWTNLFNYYQQGLIVGTGLFMSTAFAPIVWYLWIYNGSANANFYFGVTLGFGCIQILLTSSLLYNYIQKQFFFKYGKSKTENLYTVTFE